MEKEFEARIERLHAELLKAKPRISYNDLWLGAEAYVARVEREVRAAPDQDEATRWLNEAHYVTSNLGYFNHNWRPVENDPRRQYTGYICSKCGAPTIPSYSNPTGPKMIESQTCFSCNYWQEKAEELQRPDRPRRMLIIDHHIYSDAGRRGGDRSLLGFGGREFKYRRFDTGEEVTTNNLWGGARMPAEYWEQVPDNAEFVKGPW